MNDIKIIKKNKYRILYIKNKKPTTRIEALVPLGSFFENESELGLSHLLEHVLTESWSICNGSCKKYWSDKGITSNAHTLNDKVSYHIFGSSKHAHDMITYIKSITTEPVITDKLVDKSKKAVSEELLNNLNNPLYQLNDAYYRKAYDEENINMVISKKFLYGARHICDFPEKIKKLKDFKKEDVIKFFNRYKNILYVIVSDIESDDIVKMFDKSLHGLSNIDSNKKMRFSKWIKDKGINEIKITPVKINGLKKINFICGFLSKQDNYQRTSCMNNLIKDILCGSIHSIFYSKLRDELGLIYDIQLEYEYTRGYDLVWTIFEFSSSKENSDETFREFIKLVSNLKVTQKELDKSKEKLLVNDMESNKNSEFLSNFYGLNLFNFNKIIPYEECLDIIRNCTLNEINDMISKMISIKNIVTVKNSM